MNGQLAFVIFLIVLTSVCDTINHLGLKVCANTVGFKVMGVATVIRYTLRILSMPLAWISILFSLLSLFLWLYVLTMADLSFAFSLDSMHHVFIALASRAVLKENVGWQRWLGTISIMIGIVLVASSGAT
ncbi:MAG: EamA family transporter [Opitutaceae bacterium]|jgi:drug/metabolite transporter (DMT)-like permease